MTKKKAKLEKMAFSLADLARAEKTFKRSQAIQARQTKVTENAYASKGIYSLTNKVKSFITSYSPYKVKRVQ